MNKRTKQKREERALKRSLGFVQKTYWIKEKDVKKVDNLVDGFNYDFQKEAARKGKVSE